MKILQDNYVIVKVEFLYLFGVYECIEIFKYVIRDIIVKRVCIIIFVIIVFYLLGKIYIF